jgi:hypothetical protein
MIYFQKNILVTIQNMQKPTIWQKHNFAKFQTSNPLTVPGNSIAQSEMMRPEVNICFCFILITLISCKPEEHMKICSSEFC